MSGRYNGRKDDNKIDIRVFRVSIRDAGSLTFIMEL